MADIVNLRRARKDKTRRERESEAAANRRRFGRTKADKAADKDFFAHSLCSRYDQGWFTPDGKRFAVIWRSTLTEYTMKSGVTTGRRIDDEIQLFDIASQSNLRAETLAVRKSMSASAASG